MPNMVSYLIEYGPYNPWAEKDEACISEERRGEPLRIPIEPVAPKIGDSGREGAI